MAADSLATPQRFSFAFGCPTERMAQGLRELLRFGPYAGIVGSAVDDGGGRWEVLGTTHAAVWCLPSLEHLFMHLRAAGARYESPIVSLDLVPVTPCLP
jgi:hypothetical protein